MRLSSRVGDLREGENKMPLIARCRDCGQEVVVKEIREVKWTSKASGAFIIIYDCPKCKLTILEEIYKREY